jgi:hypothetical protein
MGCVVYVEGGIMSMWLEGGGVVWGDGQVQEE